MGKLIITRTKQAFFMAVGIKMMIDGTVGAKVPNGQMITVDVADGSHTVGLKLPYGVKTAPINVNASGQDTKLIIRVAQAYKALYFTRIAPMLGLGALFSLLSSIFGIVSLVVTIICLVIGYVFVLKGNKIMFEIVPE